MRAKGSVLQLLGIGLVLAAGWVVACSGEDGSAVGTDERAVGSSPHKRAGAHPGDPVRAQRYRLDALRVDRDAPRSAADGAGRAWVEGDVRVVAGGRGRWIVHYEAGELGVAVGGSIRVTIPPFWKWSRGQALAPNGDGYVTARTDAEGVRLDCRVPDGNTILVEPRGRALTDGERVRVTYGAGPQLARADSYAEKESPFWVQVDGDGDGIAGPIEDSPTIEVVAGPPAQLVVTLPSTARPGDEVTARVAILDRFANSGAAFEGAFEVLAQPEGFDAPERIEVTPEMGGVARFTARAAEAGVYRVLVRALPSTLPIGAPEDFDGWLAESNPMEVSERAPRILWADLHGHSNLTDGTGTPEDFFRYAREVAALDVASLTDHDHWGMLKVDANPRLWERIRAATEAAHAPGEFVTLLGYEWTSWIHGHRHVVYFADEGALYSSVDEAYESPLDLWAALREQGTPALTFAHHSAGGPIPTNWDIAPDPEFEPVTEVTSVHGSSEAMDSPAAIYSPVPGNFIRDALNRGYRLGFVSSGDSHDGHPGLPHLTAPSGGLAAILAEDNTREAILAAMKARRTYATNGARIILRAALGTTRMGGTLSPPAAVTDAPLLFVHAIGTAPLQRIDIIRSGEVVESIPCESAWDFSTAIDVAELQPGEYVYVRVIQGDRGVAWSSPFFVE